MNSKGLKWVAMGLAIAGITGISAWAYACQHNASQAATAPGCPVGQAAVKAPGCQGGATTCALPAVAAADNAVEAAKPVNNVCPILGIPFDAERTRPERTRQFKGQTVGFCCGPCPAKWDNLTDEQKQEALASALEKQKAAEGAKEGVRQK